MSIVGKTIGNIRVLGFLGEGGMGEVYLGFDERLKRKVALKAIRSDRLDEETKARFLREARILSQLEHPRICQIYDYIEGEENDFLVLELVRGKTLKEELANGLPYSTKLSIAEQLAGVLVEAHAKGVIHRDLKPANIMLNDRGNIKVLDFGLAWSAEEQLESSVASADLDGNADAVANDQSISPEQSAYLKTKYGDLMGTVAFMSPEQAQGERATAASDMYSFGLIAQELFTGQPAYEQNLTPKELLMKAAGAETAPVANVSRSLTELITRLTSEVQENRPTARETAARLREIRQAPRKRFFFAVGVAVLLVVIASVFKYTIDITRERKAALEARNEAIAALDQAEELATVMVDMFQVSDPDVAQGQPIDARQLLKAGAERARHKLVDQPLRQAQLMFTIAQINYRIGSWDEAEKLFEHALVLQEENLEAADPQIIATLRALGDLFVDRAEIDRGEAVLLRALALLDESSEDSRLERARTLASYGRLLVRAGRLDEGVEILRQAISDLEDELGPESPELFEPVYALAVALRQQGRCDDAEPVLHRGETLARNLGRELSVAMARMLMSRAGCVSTYDPAAAAALYQRAVDICTQLLGPEHAYVGDNRGNLGIMYRMLGRFELAEQELRRAVEILSATRGKEHSHTASVIGELGLLYFQRGELKVAATELQRSLAVFRQALASGHPWIGWNLWALANVYREQGRFEKAEQRYLEALEIQEAALPTDHADLATTREDYAVLKSLRSK